MPSLTELAARIKSQRRAAGLTVAELSARTGIPARSIVRMESGDPSAPIGRVSLVLQSLGHDLAIVPTSRPSLEDLSSIYSDDSNDTQKRSS
jgi:transcriptional regulator with XRE-family HTH domain